MNYLFFDILISGHHTEYIKHIVEFLVENNSHENNYFFVVHQNFKTTHNHISSKVNELKNIQFIEVDSKLLAGVNVKNRIKKSINNFKVMNSYANAFNIDVCYLLHLNVFQIALGIKKTNYKIRGILFMQFTNMSIKSFKDYYYFLRRFFPLIVCLRHKNLDAIFLLNDKKSSVRLNKKFKRSNLFKYLPDPIPENILETSFSCHNYYGIPAQNKIFLHFGAISRRKGVLEIIESIDYINDTIKVKITILIVGKTSDLILEKEINKKIAYYTLNSNVQLIWYNDFVSDLKMNSLFNSSDFILMPYKNPEASSGILGHAMKSKKPIIGPAQGLVGSIIKEYQLGVMLKEINPKTIAKAINNYSEITYNKHNVDEFIREHSPGNFSKVLLCH